MDLHLINTPVRKDGQCSLVNVHNREVETLVSGALETINIRDDLCWKYETVMNTESYFGPFFRLKISTKIKSIMMAKWLVGSEVLKGCPKIPILQFFLKVFDPPPHLLLVLLNFGKNSSRPLRGHLLGHFKLQLCFNMGLSPNFEQC